MFSFRPRVDDNLERTDNLSIAVQYVSTTFSMPSEDVRKLAGIPEDFEDLTPD